MSEYWDDFDKAVIKEFGGGGGVVARVQIKTGFKVYAGGVYGDEGFFATRFGEAYETEKNIALEKARQLGRPQPGTQIKMFREGAISRGELVTTWRVDQFENVNQYDTGFKEVLRPSLVENGIEAPWEGYARIGWKDDPYFTAKGDAGKEDEDQDGEPRFPRVAYVIAVLTAQEYQAALTEASGGDAQADVLAAFDGEETGLKLPKLFADSRDTWESTIRGIAEKVGGGPDPVRLVKITNALTEGHETYLDYSAADIETTPQQVLDWMNHLGV